MENREKFTSGSKGVTAFIACSKTKSHFKCAARLLYQGSLFKKALMYTERNYKYVYILSAKYGVVHPDQIIEPYEKTLNTMSGKDREEWYNKVKTQMEKLGLIKPFIFFTGKLYHEAFDGEKPLSGLSLGRQLQWFNKQNKKEGFIL